MAAMFWSAPRRHFHADQTVYIVGGGPSLVHADLSRILPASTIAINNAAIDLVPYAEVMFWADSIWATWNRDRIHRHRGRFKVSSKRHPDVASNVMRYRTDYMPLSTSQDALTGVDGGSRAINLAFLMGARDIVLVGFDMHDGGAQNYHSDHQKDDAMLNRRSAEFIPSHNAMSAALAGRGVRVRNATPASALMCYPFVRLEDTL